MIDKYVIIDIFSQLVFLDENFKVRFFNSMEEAQEVCGMYELDNHIVAKIKYIHIEE